MKLGIILFFVSSMAFSQDSKLSQKSIRSLLKENKSRSWSTCNNDSIFFKSDLIYFYNNSYSSECTETTGWHFENLKSFWQPTFFISKEYGTARSPIMTEKDHYKLKIVELENQIYFKVYNKKILKNTYLVLDAGYDNKTRCDKLILKRIK